MAPPVWGHRTVDLLFSKLVFVLRCQQDENSTLILSTLKKTFRDAFRAVECRNSGDCECCPLAIECPCNLIFGQNLALDPDALRRHQKPPFPFVFELRPDKVRREGCHTLFDLGLVLVGSATNHVKAFCAAVIEVIVSIPSLFLTRVYSADCSGFLNPVLLEDGKLSFENLATMSAEDIYAISALSPDHVRIRFLTPLRILQDGGAIREFSFSPFSRSLLRRISSLAYYYGGSILDLDYRRLSRMSEDVEVVEGDIRMAEWKGRMNEGLIGSCVLVGDLSEFHQVLLLGELLHCGKGAAYGMGCYEVERPNAVT